MGENKSPYLGPFKLAIESHILSNLYTLDVVKVLSFKCTSVIGT